EENPSLFGQTFDVEKQLVTTGIQVTRHDPTDSSAPLAEIQHAIRRRLFAAYQPASSKDRPAPIEHANVRAFVATSQQDELEQIARHVKLMAETNEDLRTDLSKIVIAIPDPASYSALIEEV